MSRGEGAPYEPLSLHLQMCIRDRAPTDAAAVGALASSVSLKRRQSTLLSGESLINDASGVVAFQFASAAALTGCLLYTSRCV